MAENESSGLPMTAKWDPQKLEQEKAELAALESKPFGKRAAGYIKRTGPGLLQSAMTLGAGSATASHAFAVRSADGHADARRLRRSNFLTSAIGLPGEGASGVRIGTNEVVRWGATADDAPELADLFARAWHAPDSALADEVSVWRRRFRHTRFHG